MDPVPPPPTLQLLSSHSGRDYEAGRTCERGEHFDGVEVHDRRDSMGTGGGGANLSAGGAAAQNSVGTGGGASNGRTAEPATPRSSRSVSANASPRDARAEQRAGAAQAADDLQAVILKPWRGQAGNLKPAQRAVLAQFEESAFASRSSRMASSFTTR